MVAEGSEMLLALDTEEGDHELRDVESLWKPEKART